jgi:hypothetical protein
METRHVEVERFARRAADYKMALQIAPKARTLEIAAVVNLVAGLCDKGGWDRHSVCIVDLMAGSGVLTRALHACGFSSVVPIEACGEMRPDDSNELGYLNGQAFQRLKATLAHEEPDIIVSLAGFHHLLQYAGTTPDKAASVAYQLDVIDTCMSSLNPGGYLLIVDITEVTNLASLNMSPIKAWAECPLGDGHLFSSDELKHLSSAKSLKQFSQKVEKIFGQIKKDCPVQWFRRIVDTRTTLGHKDCAISDPLLRVLSLQYPDSVQASLFCCPWIFGDLNQAEEFVLYKFGFLVERDTEVDRDEIRKAMVDHLGLEEVTDGRIDLDWALCGIAIRNDEKPAVFDPIMIVTLILTVALVAIIFRIIGRLMYASDAVDEVLGGTFWMACGAAVGIGIDVLKRRFTLP